MIEIPKTRTMSDAERFCYGLRQLVSECNVKSITWSNIGITTYEFEDGSSIGSVRAHKEAGVINNK